MKRAYIFDFDETLVTTEARIHVYKNGAHVGEMNSKEFNFYKPKPGENLDFTEFKDGELIMNAKRYKMWPVLRNVNKIVAKYDDIMFFDDDPKNIAMAASIKGIRTRLVENMGAPMATAMSTPGMGNVTPAGPGTIGSGDKFGNTIGGKPYTQGRPLKKKRRKKKIVKEDMNEQNINPYDKIGTAMAKKMGVKTPFKKKKSKKNQNSMVQKKFEHEIITLDEFTQLINEGERPLYDAREEWKEMMKRDKKSLIGELSQLYRVHSQSEKDSKSEIISAILDAKHSRWSAESSDFKNK